MSAMMRPSNDAQQTCSDHSHPMRSMGSIELWLTPSFALLVFVTGSPLLPTDTRTTSSLPSPTMPRSSSSHPPLLPSVCLCAIVKNERVNPAGGISAYLDRILHAVHTAVIVDTGSGDGTLEVLRERESAEPRGHLHVFETPFVSFADARNDALRKALEVRDQQLREGRPTFKHILVLDADEMLTAPCIELLASVLALDRSSASSSSSDLLPAADSSSMLSLEKSSSLLSVNSSRSSAVHSASPSLNALSPPRTRSRAPSCADKCALSPAATEAAVLADAFAGFMLPVAALAPPSSAPSTPLALLPYPLALKCSCHCYAASGVASPRSNSGLWNPRIFSADARFSFVNMVDNYRFERLLFAGKEVQPECYLRESDLPEPIRSAYDALRVQELRAASAEGSTGAAAAAGGDSPSSASSSTHGFSFGVDAEFDELTSPAAPASSAASGGTSTSTASVSPSPPADGVDDDSFDLRVSSPSRSQALLVPMRHFIPSVSGRRAKNQAYKEGGARAKAAAVAAMAASGATASVDSPCSLSSRSLSGSYSPLPPGSRSPQPKTTPSSRSRIYQPTNGGQ